MRLSFILKNRSPNNTDQQWHWPSCNQRKIPKNSDFSDPSDEIIQTPETRSSKSYSESKKDHYCSGFSDNDSLESIIKGVRSSSSGRLFFEPQETKSLTRDEKKFDGNILPFKEGVAVSMESKDPYGDFKKSMQEMIGSHKSNDLEKLLGWYLKMNDKRHHGFIVEAFADMFLELATYSSSSHSSSNVVPAERS